MKRKLFSIITALALCLGLLPAGAWAAGEDAATQPRAAATDINMEYSGAPHYLVFAQGVPIVIKDNNGITSIYDTEGKLLSGDGIDVSNCAIYGGWYDLGNTHTASTSVTMESGTVQAIFGGSYSDILDGDTNITFRGGTASAVYGGGNYSTVTGNTNITLDGGTAGWVYGGGYSSTVTGTAHVTVNSGVKVWGDKMSNDTADRGTVFGGGSGGSVSNTEVVFNGGDAGWIYGGGYQCTSDNTCVKFMGQPDGDTVSVFGGSNGGSVDNATVEFHGKGYSPTNQVAFFYGGGWGDTVDHAEFIIGPNCDPGSAFFEAVCDGSGSSVGSVRFDVSWDPARPSMMNSSRLKGTGATGTVTAYLHSDSSRDGFVYTGLTEIDELILEGLRFTADSADGIDLDRLEIKASAAIAVPAKAGIALNVNELAGSGYIYFEKFPNAAASITPITVEKMSVPSGARIKVGRLGGLPDTAWENASLFTGAGVGALTSLECFVSVTEGYELTKDGSTVKVQAGTGPSQAYLDPIPTFDRENKTYRYGETIKVTMGLKCADQPLAGQVLSVEGGSSGHQSFATGTTDENGMVTISVPVNDSVWNSRSSALMGYFAGTEEYKGSGYAVCGADGNLKYTINPAQVTLSGEITAPARGGVPVKSLTVGGDAVCTAEVVWSPADAAFRPEVAYTASIRLIPKQGFRLDGGRLDGVTYQGRALTLPGSTEADGSIMIPNVAVFAPIPAIHVTGITLDQTAISLNVGESARLTAAITPADSDNKAVTWASSNTAIATVDSSGNVTAVSAGTATITVTAADGGRTAACTVTVRTSSGGNSGGSGGSGGGSNVTVPVSGDQSTVHVSASVSGSTAAVSKIDTAQIEHVVGENGQASMVEIDFTGLGRTIDTVKLPTDAIKAVAAKAQKNEVRGLTVKLPDSEISFDADALSAIQAQAGSQITLIVTRARPADLNSRQKEAAGSAPVFNLTLRSGSGAITDFRGGYATVSLPYTLAAGQDPSGVVVYNLDSTGNITPCATMYDAEEKSAIFTTGHFSLYFVGYDPAAAWANPYSDVAGDAWYYDAVQFVSENGLMGGYGNGKFDPNGSLSRAQFIQILFNKEGRPVVNYLLQYSDVATGAWYTEAVRWAASQGIVSGYGNGKFGPGDKISREQLAAVLWRYAGSPAAVGGELRFTDAYKASGYALDALRWAVENGLLSGYSDGRLNPGGLVTRAQAAQILMNFLKTE